MIDDGWFEVPCVARRNVIYDVFGNTRVIAVPLTTMLCPALCGICGSAFDLAACQVMARYSDCDVFRTTCCNRRMDTRRAHNPYRGYYPINHDGTLRR